MTPKQREVLAFVGNHPGCGGARFVFVSTRRKWTRQGATRWGCGYAQPLVAAGLLAKRAADVGGASYTLTAKGFSALAEHAFALSHAKDIERTVIFGLAV